jgi:hypothetical protein
MSDKNIDKGTAWFAELHNLLARVRACIICVTKENVRSPWLLYEAGAISGRTGFVCPYLVGVEPSMLADGPLIMWQCARATKIETLSLIYALNKTLDENRRHHATLLNTNFEVQWPAFESQLSRIVTMDVQVSNQFVTTDADQLAGVNLSSEARSLLIEASNDPNGIIIFVRSSVGTHIQVHGRAVADPSNTRAVAVWKEAIDHLVAYGLLELRGKGEIFALTGKGYRIADLLKQGLPAQAKEGT